MRFSIKWMFAAVAYSAVACASVSLATTAWTDAFTTIGFLTCGAAVVGVAVGRQASRKFFVGFLTFALLTRIALFAELEVVSDWRATINRCMAAAVYLIPSPRPTAEEMIQFVTQDMESNPSFRQTQERMQMIRSTLSPGDPRNPNLARRNLPMPRDALATALGGVAAGALRGAEESSNAEDVLDQLSEDDQRRLRNYLLSHEQKSKLPAVSVLRQHLILFFSFLGGLLGLCFHRREGKAPD